MMELLSGLQDHDVSARKGALVDLRELLRSKGGEEILRSEKGKILEEVAKLIMDQEREVRKSAMKLLEEILEQVEAEQLSPHFKMLLSYLGCSFTHIHPNVQEDGLMMLGVLLKAAPSLVAENACQILPNFLNMISRLKSESEPEGNRTMNLGSAQVSMKWQFNILGYVHNLLTAMVEHYRSKCPKEDSEFSSSSSDTGKLKNFADDLMPLLTETWLEALPSDSQQKSVLSAGRALLLRCMVEIIQLLWELLLLWERRKYSTRLSTEFASAHRKDFETHFVRGLPYTKANSLKNEWSDLYVKSKQQQPKQETSSLSLCWKDKTVDENCSEINLKLCSLFCHLHDTDSPPADICTSVVEYTKAYMNSLQSDNPFPEELMPLVQMLLMKHSESWRLLGIDFLSLMDVLLMCAVNIRPPLAVVEELTEMICEVAISIRLEHLHSSPMFLNSLCSLPELLLRPTVSVTVIKAIVALAYQSEQFGNVLQAVLNSPSVRQNLEKIQITGVATELEGKLRVAGIFYCARKLQECKSGCWSEERAVSLADELISQLKG